MDTVIQKSIGGGSFAGNKIPDAKKLANLSDKFIYHSGTIDQLPDMKWGLEPQHGDWIKEIASGATEEPDEILDRSIPLVWMSDHPNWVASKVARKLGKHVKDVTENDIREHGHVAMIPRKGDHAEHIWKVGDDGLNNGPYSIVKNLNGKVAKAYETDLYDSDMIGQKEPFGVERNEYISARPVEPMFHLTGQDLVDFLHYTKQLPHKDKGGKVDGGITSHHGEEVMVEDYRGEHQAPGRNDDVGAPLHDTTGVYPPDFYGPKGLHYYGDKDDPIDQESYRHAIRLKGNPDAPVWIHRAIPIEVYKKAMKHENPIGQMIRKGDWVTPTKAYAKQHGESVLNGKYKIASKRVKAKDVFTNGDSLNEWGYDPEIHKDKGGEVDGDGITAYHGSPHEFEKFDTSKIGTGEGAQAYGHGLYFAESEQIARDYRDRLTDVKSTYRVGNYDMPKWVLRKLEDSADRAEMIKNLKNNYNNTIQENLKEKETSSQPWLADQRISYAKDILAGLEHLEKGAEVPHTRGHMYEVHIDAHPDHFLDWDKQFDDQSPHVKKALTKLVASGELRPAIMNLKGENIHAHIMNKFDAVPEMHGFPAMKGDPEQASKFLSDHGIHGIRYLDAGSRGNADKPTHNYVVFDHNRVKIKRRYAHGGEVEGEEIEVPHSLKELQDWSKTHPHHANPNVVFTRKESIIEGAPPIVMPANLTELQKFKADGGAVDEYPLARDDEKHLTEMAPDTFLNRARPLKNTEDNRETVNDFKKEIKAGHKLDPLALYPHNRENGRHRATAAKELGIKKVPVHDYRKRDGGAIVKRALMIISKKA